jgi:glycosyltransferase involved in cell wall biosynthesis
MSEPLRAFDCAPELPVRVSVVIPALNEERNLEYVFGRIPSGVAEVILVDGGSVDRTVEVARELLPSVIVVEQTRTGKGNALACGFEVCTGDVIVMIDADGSTDPVEIPKFVKALTDGADFAKGSRFLPGGHSDDITRLRRVGNYGLNAFVNLLFRTRFTDLCYGYNAFWRRILPYLELPDVSLPAAAGKKLWGDGFEIETVINVRVAAHHLKVQEVASIESHRLHGVSNLNAVSDGLRVLRTILTEFQRLRSPAANRLPLPAEVAATALVPAAVAALDADVPTSVQTPTAQSAGPHLATTIPQPRLGRREQMRVTAEER